MIETPTYEIESQAIQYRAKINYIKSPGKQFGSFALAQWETTPEPTLEAIEPRIKEDGHVLGWIDFYSSALLRVRYQDGQIETLHGKDQFQEFESLIATNPREIMTTYDIMQLETLPEYLQDWLTRLRVTDRPHPHYGWHGQKRSDDIRKIIAKLPMEGIFEPRFEQERNNISAPPRYYPKSLNPSY